MDQESAEHRPILKGSVKKEPTSNEEDGEDCQLVAYLPLPHGVIKEEFEVGQDEYHSEIRVIIWFDS